MLAPLRLLKLFARRRGTPPRDPLDTCVTHWRVLPGDIDAFGHLNNARYQSFMDLARVDFLLQCGLFKGVLRKRWMVPVGMSSVSYRKSLKPFERFELHTRLVHWDERWFYFQQDFYRHGDLSRPVATGHVKTLFMGRRGVASTEEVIAATAGRPLQAPALTDALRAVFQLGGGAPQLPEPPALPGPAAREPLAIVGIGCRLPGGIEDVEGFWNFLMHGGDAIVDIPSSRWDAKRYHDPTGASPGRAQVQRAGLLQQDLQQFDAAFFGITPREAEVMDPQQRLLLETSWEALEDAGIAPASLAGSRTAVYTGGFMLDNLMLRTREGGRDQLSSASAIAGTMTMLSSRLSYFYDLRGPSLSIDTACSSSLVACHHACESLWRGESDMAMVAGVNALLMPEMQVTMSKGQFLSPRGRCHAFGEDADGYVRGEGAAVVLLRPLSAALRDGQRVYAVIRGSACNQDGRTSGITVPSGDAQMAVMREAYAKAGIAPRDVAYVEAHGTGTPVGDPIEAGAIGAVIGAGRGPDERCVMASVKTNLGHLEAAAGITGLIKAALCVQRGMAPPHLHAQRVNPRIDLDSLGLALPQQATPLQPRQGLLVAGVNSFGYGGTNAHVAVSSVPVVEGAAQAVHPATPRRQTLLLPLSARSPESLAQLAERYADALDQHPDQAPALLQTATLHRAHHRRRGVLIGKDAPGLAAAAREGRFAAQAESDGPPPLVFVYSGMGPQWWGMGRQLFEQEPVYRDSVLASDEVFRRIAGWSILAEMQRDEVFSRITRTEFAQPANAVLQIGLGALWASWGVRPAAVIGHSIGEVAAAHACGALDLEQALTVAYHRSRLQQGLAGRGGMLAAGLSAQDAQELVERIGTGLSVAAVNSHSSVTLAGDTTLLESVARELDACGVFCSRLQVELPYHSATMDEIGHDLRQALAGLRPREPALPVYSTVSGSLMQAPWHDAAYWWRNVRETVQFSKALHTALADGHRHFLEVGPHPVLAGNMRDALREAGLQGQVLGSLSRKVEDERAMAETLGRLYTLGAEVDWAAYLGPGPAARAPSYPWHRKLHWTEPEGLRAERTGAFPAHPMLTTRQPGPMTTWTAELNLGRMPWLLDHVAANTPLLPAAAFIELALAARADLSGQVPVSIENLDLVSAVELRPAQSTHLLLQHATDAPAFRISAQVDGAQPQLCVRGHWTSAVARDERVDLDEVAARLPLQLSAQALYERLATMGLKYGSAFRCVQRLQHSAHEVMAWLATEPEHEAGFALAPGLLDAALHSMLALGGERYRGCELMPTGIREFSFYRSPGRRAVVVGTLDTTRAEPRCDLVLLAEDGQVCARVRGLAFQVLRHAEPEASSFLYERRYVAHALSAAPAPELAGAPLIVLGNPRGAPPKALRATDHRELARLLTRVEQPALLVDLRFGGATDERALLEDANDAAHRFLATLQAIAPGRVGRYVLVTQQAEHVGEAHEAPALSAALLLGMARTAMTERPDLQMTLLDVDELPPDWTDWLPRLGEVQEWALRAGQWRAAQVHRAELPAATAALIPFDRQHMNCELKVGTPGKLDTLHFAQCERVPPGPGQVEIEVELAPLGYKDVMKALGILSSRAAADTFFGDAMGMECVGRVVAKGEGVDHVAPGDRVYAAASGSLRAFVTADAGMVTRLPDGLDFEAATNLVAYGTVYHGLVEVARLARGERVLVHGGTGGVGLAAIAVARWLGAEVIATAGTPAKRELLRGMGVQHVAHSRDTSFHDDVMRWTGGRGVDVVLNFTPGDVLLKSLSCLARFGRFVEIGKVAFDQDTPLPLRAFNEGLSFSALDFDRMTRHKPQQVRAIAERVLQHLAAGDFAPTPSRRHAASDAGEAFRVMARGEHVGKLLIDMKDPTLQVQALPSRALRSDGTYVVTGGLGGFGLEVARDLVARGARHLALLSRQGEATPGAAAQLQAWRAQGVQARAFAVDVSDAAALAKSWRRLRRDMPVVKGIVHAAAVLDDHPIDQLDTQALQRSFAAKAHGAWHLHRLSAGRPLDFFVLCSSISAVIGNAGQAAYAGANHFLDQLAAWSRARGLPAQSIQWGVLGESGMVARQATLGRYLAQQGVRPLGNAVALEAMARVLQAGTAAPAALVVADVDWAGMADRHPPHTGGERLAAWRGTAGAPSTDRLRERWLEDDPAQLRQRIEDELLRITSGVMRLDRAEMHPTQALRDMGMDSLMALEVSLEIETVFGLKLPTMALASGPAVRELAQRLEVELHKGRAQPAPAMPEAA